jgi:two-component system NarL family sensor kinase
MCLVMKKNIVLLFCISVFILCRAQIKADSLKQIMTAGHSYPERMGAYLAYLELFQLKNFDHTLEVAAQALKLARDNGDSLRVAIIQRHTGAALYFKGDYDDAAQHFYHSAALLEKMDNNNAVAKKELAYTYNDIAKLYRKTRDLNRSLQYYDNAFRIFRQRNDSAGMAMILNESGVVYEYKGNYDEAIRRYESSMKIAEALNNQVSISYSLNFIAGVQTIQKKYDAAIENLMKCIRIRQQLNDSFALALAYTDLGAVYNAKGDYSKALEALEKSNGIAIPMGYPELQSNNLNEMASVAQKMGDYKKALEYFQRRAAIRDSIFNIEKTRQIEELNARYETAKKEQLIERQRFRISRQNYLIAGIVVLVVLSGITAWSQYRRYRLKQEAKLQSELLKQQELAAKAVLEAEEEERQRIAKELHDGVGQMMSAARMNLSAFETTTRLTDKDQKQSLEKIIQLVDESCREVRHVSHNMMPMALMKKNLSEAIHDFISKLDKKNLEVQLHTEGIDERMDSAVEGVLYRIVQECVNNVLKHAGASQLDISIIKDVEGISATIEDNGKGFNTEEMEKFNGIGLKSITSRIGYLKGTVEFDSAPGRGTVVSLFVPTPVGPGK